MTQRVLLLNGIESAGVRSVDRVGALLEPLGYDVIDVPLKRVPWHKGRDEALRTENLRRISEYARFGDHVVAHSNGCRLCWDMLDGGFHFGHLFWFAPALDADLTLRDCCFRHLDVFANPHDKALLVAGMLPGHPWGAMGRVGYKGRNVWKARTLVYPERRGLGHNHYFEGDLLQQVVRVIDQELSLGVTAGGA